MVAKFKEGCNGKRLLLQWLQCRRNLWGCCGAIIIEPVFYEKLMVERWTLLPPMDDDILPRRIFVQLCNCVVGLTGCCNSKSSGTLGNSRWCNRKRLLPQWQWSSNMNGTFFHVNKWKKSLPCCKNCPSPMVVGSSNLNVVVPSMTMFVWDMVTTSWLITRIWITCWLHGK